MLLISEEKKFLNVTNPQEAKPLFCFSSESTLTLVKALYPEQSASFLSLRELMLHLGYSLPSICEHELAFHSLLPSNCSPEEAHTLYQTIQALRESLVIKKEHAEHCFSQLAESKKNTNLKSILFAYLNSPLTHDLAQVTWQCIGELKEKKRKLDFPLYFISEASESFLFSTLSENYPRLNPWEIFPKVTPTQGALYFGSHSETLLGFKAALKNWKKEQNYLQLWIPFHAGEKELEYLKFLLNAEHIAYKSFFEEKMKEAPSAQSLALEAVRKDKNIPLKERLQLSQKMLQKKNGEASPSLGTQSTPQDISTPVAFLYPFQVLTPPSTASVIGVCDSSYLKGEPSSLLFSDAELESLFQAGFPLIRRSKTIEQRKLALENASTQNHKIYTSLPKQGLSLSIAPQSIALTYEELSSDEKYQADVKINRLSATQLETYSQCPAKYFFLNKLRMRAPLTFKDTYALVLGQTVHLALENSCKTKFPFTLEELNEHYTKALKEYIPEEESSESHTTILNAQFKLISDRVIALEKTLQEQFGEGKPIFIEEAFELDIEGLKFTGKIDRVDLREGKLVILDYKTGNVDFTPEHIRKGENFQALLYLLAIEQKSMAPISGMLFYDLKQGELRRGVLIEEEVSKETKKTVTRGHTLPLEKYETLKKDGVDQIKRLAERMNSGDFTPNPSTDKCNYCEARIMCRKAYGYV